MQRHSHKLLMAVLAVLLVLAASEAVAGGHPHHGYHGGSPYYYGGGGWYRPYGARFMVVAPPFYTTLWFGGAPYYYANDTYYRYHAARREYVVAEPTRGKAKTMTEADSAELYAYPRNGQTEERQSVDRDDCHRWAVAKAGFDPAKSVGANHSLSDFRRAEGACLDARGYSVK